MDIGPISDAPIYQRVRHVKTGGIYRVICGGRLEADLTRIVVYQSEQTGETWVRPRSEFTDGRFEPVEPTVRAG